MPRTESNLARADTPDQPAVGARVAGWSRALATRVRAGLRRRVDEAFARRDAERERGDPTRALELVRAARSVLVLCHGNIIRSPFTACLLKQSLGPSGKVAVTSAGLHAVPGTPSPVAPMLAAQGFKIDLREHSASLVTAERVRAADVVFVMDIGQLAAMRRRFPFARAKTLLLATLAPDTPLEVRDPVMGGQALCRACFEHIEKAVRPVIAALTSEDRQRA